MQSTALSGGQITPVRVVSSFERIRGAEALTILEILRAILDHTAPSTLVSAACVSRAWSTVALDKLWFDFDVKVIDLLRVLPFEPVTYWKRWRDPTNEEWTRFQSYASRIRSLSMPGGDIPDWSQFNPLITEWKLKNDVLFPRLRRVEWSTPIKLPTLSPALSSFTTSVLSGWWMALQVATSTLHDLAAIEGLRLKKFKLRAPDVDLNFGHAIADFITTQKDTLQTVELLASCPAHESPLVGQSLGNLTALDIQIPHGDAQVANAIQALVEGCPRVSYLRMGITAGKFDRATLGWQLQSFDVWSSEGSCVGKGDIADMARAWPKLKKLGFKRRVRITEPRIYWDTLQVPDPSRTPLSRLADIISGFSELEELSADFFFDLNERVPLASHCFSSPMHCGSRLRKLLLGHSSLPESKEERDTMGVFMAAVCPPGLRIQHPVVKQPPSGRLGDLTPWVETEEIARAGRDVGSEWDELFQKIEELHEGIKIRVGSIPEEDDAVWF